MKLLYSRRIWAVIIAIVMMLSIAPAAALADAVSGQEIPDPDGTADDSAFDAETAFDVTVTITGHREEFVYDAETHVAEGYDVLISDPRYSEADFAFTGTAAVEGAGARTYPMGLSEDQFENTNPNANVTFRVIDGELKIRKRRVVLRSESAVKEYDGTALEKQGFEILGEGFAADEMPIILVTGSITNVGKIRNRIIVSFQNAHKGSIIHTINPDNYEIKLNEGTLEITPKEVLIKANDQLKAHGAEDPDLTAEIKGLLNGDSVAYSVVRREGEHSGYYTIMPEGEPLQGNYRVAFESGTLHIKMPPREMNRFTLAWFSDAKIAADGARTDALEAMVSWTAENAASKNIIGLFGTGSLAGTFNDAATEARGAGILSGVRAARRDLRYYGAAGVIDVNGDEMNYGPCANRGVRGASVSFRNGEIWVQQLFRTGVIAIGIGYHKSAETEEEQSAQRRWVRYVNERIASQSDRNTCTILFVNDYVDEAGRLTPFGELVESEIVAKNPSVRLVLSSCASGAVHTEAKYGDRTVNVLAFNYAEDEANGLGYLRLLTFDPATHDVEVSTYSPVSGKTVFSEAAPEADTFTMKNAF